MTTARLSPQKLVHLYEQLSNRIEESTRPIQHLAGYSNRSVDEVLAAAKKLDIPTNGEETSFTGKQAAAIIRELFNLDSSQEQ